MSKTLNDLLDHYSASHQNPINQRIHWVAVPLIALSSLGMLAQWSYPITSSFNLDFNLNGALVFLFLVCLYYLRFRQKNVFLVVLIQVVPMLAFIYLNPYSSFYFYLVVFAIAWVGQFIGHKIEGKKPSFVEDIQYLLIGPLWVFHRWIRF